MPVIVAECMCCENVVLTKFPFILWNAPRLNGKIVYIVTNGICFPWRSTNMSRSRTSDERCTDRKRIHGEQHGEVWVQPVFHRRRGDPVQGRNTSNLVRQPAFLQTYASLSLIYLSEFVAIYQYDYFSNSVSSVSLPKKFSTSNRMFAQAQVPFVDN